MRYLLDTNIFYDIASKKIDYYKIVSLFKSNNFYVTPINIIEIISSTNNDFNTRKNAAIKFIDCVSEGAVLLCDSNMALEQQLKNSIIYPHSENDYMQLIRLFTTMDSENGFNSKIKWGYNNKVYSIDYDNIRRTRNKAYKGFCTSCLDMKSKIIKAYGGVHRLSGRSLKEYRNDKKQLLNYNIVTKSLTKRINNCYSKCYSPPSVIPKNLKPYADLYHIYCVRLFEDNAKPDINDFGDIEQLVYYGKYADILITREKRWLKLAKRAGYNKLILSPSAVWGGGVACSPSS